MPVHSLSVAVDQMAIVYSFICFNPILQKTTLEKFVWSGDEFELNNNIKDNLKVRKFILKSPKKIIVLLLRTHFDSVTRKKILEKSGALNLTLFK
jgi:hypothetical protein